MAQRKLKVAKKAKMAQRKAKKLKVMKLKVAKQAKMAQRKQKVAKKAKMAQRKLTAAKKKMAALTASRAGRTLAIRSRNDSSFVGVCLGAGAESGRGCRVACKIGIASRAPVSDQGVRGQTGATFDG